ncbi:uncharacterized protein LOC124655629 [Lolium rigidum]|uniref:uncharacterized protein LOC124655629 n=1 Tax=Lolium rigidum TaxID=89674 RepID=UPI001F5D2467|nr:uncharacterized protein LOC124655629 [Lolium rigidum]
MASSAVSQSHSGQLHPPAGSMMARVDRLDLVVGYLEEMRHGSARSSTSPSTPTTLSSSSPTTPRSTGRCRPAEELLRETKAKGSLVERIAFLENRVLRMEEERLSASSFSMEITPERTSRLSSSMNSAGNGTGSGRKKKGLKSLVKSCVRGGAKLKTKE